MSHYNLISQHLKLRKGQSHWPFQKAYYNYLQQLLLGFWKKNNNKGKPQKWLTRTSSTTKRDAAM